MFRAVYNRFGPERLIWGSDFPHILLQSGYARSRRWLERACDYLSSADLAMIMGENASGLYWGK
jgi:predicted TIM-barrel fold metal-dependent hydrolase